MVDHVRLASPGPTPSRPSRARGRVPVILGIVALLVVGGLADRSGASGRPLVAPILPVPVAAPSAALSSTWFCGGATEGSRGAVRGSLVVANPTGSPLSGTVTLMVAGQAASAPRSVRVAAGTRLVVLEGLHAGVRWVGAQVTLNGGGAAVEQQVQGPLGVAAQPCATVGSPSWYFPTGTTLRDASDAVSLLNPYPADAIVDMSFVTDQGAEDPSAFQAILVPAHSLVMVDLASHLRRRTTIATTVTARTGQIVAWQTQIVTPPAKGTAIVGAPPPRGLSGPVDPAPPVGGVILTLGAPAPATTWRWPDGVAGRGVTEQYVVYNPGSATAQVRLTLGLDQGGATPVSMTVGPTSEATVTTNTEAQVPSGAAHDATLTSVNGVGVIAARTITAVSPSPRTGLGALMGGPVAADRWLLPAGGATSHLDEWVEIQNPATTPVTVAIAQLEPTGPHPLAGLEHVTVAGGGRLAIRVAQHVTLPFADSLLVDASGPVVVERDLYGTAAPGIGVALGVPLTP